MNGLRPPLTAPPGFAVRQSRSDSKECCRPALLFREGEFPWQTRKPIKNISSAGTTPLARLLSAVPDSVRPCRNYVELHIILLYFPAFCDTILILINFTAENSRWNINIFAKVFPAKSPQIHPTISEFAEGVWLYEKGMDIFCDRLCSRNHRYVLFWHLRRFLQWYGLWKCLCISSLRIKKQGEVKNFCRSHPAGPRRIWQTAKSETSLLTVLWAL